MSTKKVTLTRPSSVEVYQVPVNCDKFVTTAKLDGYSGLELQAYYNGEFVTEVHVNYARELLVDLTPLPHPIKSVGRSLVLFCQDGRTQCTLDIGTLCRYFELVEDLYELDPEISSLELPFPVNHVLSTLFGLFGVDSERTPHLDAVLPILRFLRLKKSIYYLRYDCSATNDVELLHQIALEMPLEYSKRRAEWTHIIDDDRIWPILNSINCRDLAPEKCVLMKLLHDRPSTLLAVLCIKGYTRGDYVLNLICTSKFEDRLVTNVSVHDRSLVVERIIGYLRQCNDAKQHRHVQAILGVEDDYLSYKDIEVIHPFSTPLTLTSVQRQVVDNYYLPVFLRAGPGSVLST